MEPRQHRFTILVASFISVISIISAPDHLAQAQLIGANSPLSRCEIGHTPISDYFIQFSIHLMSYVENRAQLSEGVSSVSEDLTTVMKTRRGRFVLKQIDHNSTNERLEAVGVNASLPFLFFLNGFNAVDEYGNVSNTWMFDVVKTFAKRKVLDNNDQDQDLERAEDRVNLVFITWSLPYYWEINSALSLLPAYLKTMAYYERIFKFVSGTIKNMIDLVEDRASARSVPSDRKQRRQQRRDFYRRFQFYGHSLGSHIMSDAVMRVHEQTGLKFGRLAGLDPANPCFLSLEHGMSVKRMAAAVEQLMVVHSNAGFAGLANERADVEVVLNGGTFQPGCFWLDFSCSHARSTDIFGYLDDQCQMVAYKCSSYQHFKIGACETCESVANSNDSQYTINHKQSPNCVAINLPEQYSAAKEILDQLDRNDDALGGGGGAEQPIRQLAQEDDDEVGPIITYYSSGAKAANTRTGGGDLQRQAAKQQEAEQQMRYNHYVNTNANFREGRKTHCLQHYQIRLLINYDSGAIKRNCPISSFYVSRGEKIRLGLSAQNGDEHSTNELRRRRRRATSSVEVSDGAKPSSLHSKPATTTRGRVEDVIKDSLYTSLITFESAPELFVGSTLDNIDLDGLSKCLAKNQGSDNKSGGGGNTNQSSGGAGLQIVMDVAFMSNTNRKIRRAFSSILCGHTRNTPDQFGSDAGLVLTLCRPSELANVSSQIDGLLDQIKDENFYENWTISLLNSLFSLFTEWEPLKQQRQLL